MKFWDTSALVPLLADEDTTDAMTRLFREDRNIAASFITRVELASALSRKAGVNDDLLARATRRYAVLEANWMIVDDYATVTATAEVVATRHGLRAGDAIQLASAMLLMRPNEHLAFVSLDVDLKLAARAEGLLII